jgi:hypothetical protein
VDAAVVLEKHGRDGERAFERAVAAFDDFLALCKRTSTSAASASAGSRLTLDRYWRCRPRRSRGTTTIQAPTLSAWRSGN